MTRTKTFPFYYAQAAGEFAFCKHFGVPFEPDSDGRFDVTLDGASIEVVPAEDAYKSVLTFERKNDFRKDVTVVTNLRGGNCELIGWIDRDRFRRLFKAATALGYGVRPLVLDRSALLPMEDLRAFVRENRRAA